MDSGYRIAKLQKATYKPGNWQSKSVWFCLAWSVS